jgi:hypothetical protein
MGLGAALTMRGEYRRSAIGHQDVRPTVTAPGAFAGIQGHAMSSISVNATHSLPASTISDQPLKTITLFCSVGLLASLCLMTLGIDLGAAWL